MPAGLLLPVGCPAEPSTLSVVSSTRRGGPAVCVGKQESPCELMLPLQLPVVAGEWQSNTTLGGGAIHHLPGRPVDTGVLSPLFASPGAFRKIEPPPENRGGFTSQSAFPTSLKQSAGEATLTCVFKRGQSTGTE